MAPGKRRRIDSNPSQSISPNWAGAASDDHAMAPMAELEPRVVSTKQDKVTLDVGGRKFVTLASTLHESTFFRSLISGRWEHDRQPDGSHFIDADPDLFAHVLEYLRRGRMPLFWDREKGHDFDRYKALSQEADYYGIPRLESWLRTQKFLEAITVGTRVTYRTMIGSSAEAEFTDTAAFRRRVETDWADELRYWCPALRRSAYHALPDRCHEECEYCEGVCGGLPYGGCKSDCQLDRAASEDHPAEMVRVLKVKVVEDFVIFKPEVCDPQ